MTWTTRLSRELKQWTRRFQAAPSRGHTDARDARNDEQDERSEINRESDRIDVERGIQADAPDVSTPESRKVQELLAEASHRDHLANRRDSAANDRDIQAGLGALLADSDSHEAFEARAFARQDRRSSRHDRVASSEDRIQLSTHAGQLSLPTRIPVQRGVSKPLMQSTAAEVADYSAQLLAEALSETRAAIDMVDHAGEATAQVKDLLAKARDHQDDADDLLWYVNEWLRTGHRPQPPVKEGPLNQSAT